jgi:hypothetical protein
MTWIIILGVLYLLAGMFYWLAVVLEYTEDKELWTSFLVTTFFWPLVMALKGRKAHEGEETRQ